MRQVLITPGSSGSTETPQSGTFARKNGENARVLYGRPNWLFFATLALSACAQTPPPAIEVRTVTVEVPIATSCVRAADIPTEPATISDKLTGNASADLNTVAASAVRLRAWGRTLVALLGACVLPE